MVRGQRLGGELEKKRDNQLQNRLKRKKTVVQAQRLSIDKGDSVLSLTEGRKRILKDEGGSTEGGPRLYETEKMVVYSSSGAETDISQQEANERLPAEQAVATLEGEGALEGVG